MTAPDARFSEYKTYEWLPPRILTRSGLIENDDTISPVVRRALDRELAKQGLMQVAEGADLQVSTLAFRESIPQVEALVYPGGIPGTVGMPITIVGRYNHQGTLVINLIDTATKKSAWAALATDSLGKPDQLESKVNKAVANMFKKYPAPRKSKDK